MTKHNLSGAALKTMACLSMLIDHFFAVAFFKCMKLYPADGFFSSEVQNFVYQMGRAVGRIAFILFAFLIVEGFAHTKSRLRFLLRLFLFALLSEIPFDLAFSGKIIDWESQNVYWTLFLGVLMLALWERLGEYGGILPWLGRFLVLAAGGAAAYFAATDYRFMGVFLIFAFYLTRGAGMERRIFAVGSVMLFGTFGVNLLRYAGRFSADYLFSFSLREMYGLFAFIPIARYDGSRGRQLPKVVYYGFYPVHLLFYFGLVSAIGVM